MSFKNDFIKVVKKLGNKDVSLRIKLAWKLEKKKD